jgi:hypothetical protein
MADEFVQPTQPRAGLGDDVVLRLVRRQVGEHDVERRNRERDPERQRAREHERPEREPGGEVREGPNDGEIGKLVDVARRDLSFATDQFGLGQGAQLGGGGHTQRPLICA